jgi:hypothetical protein
VLRARLRERRVICGGDFVAWVVLARPPHQQGDRQVLGSLHEVTEHLPGVAHALVAGEEPGVGDDEPRHALGLLDRYPQADRPAPVVHDDGGVVQIEVLEERGGVRGMTVVRVPAEVGGLVGAAEADEVGHDHPVSRVAHGRQHLAPQKAPGRLAVEHHDRRPVAVLDVRHPHAVHVAVARLPREVRQILEALVGRAVDVQGPPA